MRLNKGWCCFCAANHTALRLAEGWYAIGLRHNQCVSRILDDASQALRSRAPDSVVMAAAINIMAEDGLLETSIRSIGESVTMASS